MDEERGLERWIDVQTVCLEVVVLHLVFTY